MMKRFVFLLLITAPLLADSYFDQYQTLFVTAKEAMGPKGSYKLGEVEILLDPEEIETLRKNSYEALRREGISPDKSDKWTRVGVIGQDSQWWLIRDATKLPDSSLTLYDRLISQEVMEGNKEIAILPVTQEGEVMLALSYRHATRSWELEIPRGISDKENSLTQSATELLKELYGVVAKEGRVLGVMNPSSDIVGYPVSLLTVVVEKKEKPGLYFLPMGELKKAIKAGHFYKGNLRDPYLTYGLYLFNE